MVSYDNFPKIFYVDSDETGRFIAEAFFQLYFKTVKVFCFSSVEEVHTAIFIEKIPPPQVMMMELDDGGSTENAFEFIGLYEKEFSAEKSVLILTNSLSVIDLQKAKEYSIIKEYFSKPLTKEMIPQISRYFPVLN
jgi:hypothetical protein